MINNEKSLICGGKNATVKRLTAGRFHKKYRSGCSTFRGSLKLWDAKTGTTRQDRSNGALQEKRWNCVDGGSGGQAARLELNTVVSIFLSSA